MSGIVAQNVARPSGLIKAAGGGGGTWVEITSITASSDDTIDFVDGASDVVLDSTYPVYCFKFTNIHPETNNTNFAFNGSIDGGSNYNVAKLSTFFLAYHAEDDSGYTLAYDTGNQLVLGTGVQYIARDIGNDNDQCIAGMMYLFAPSSTTFSKKWMTDMIVANQADLLVNVRTSGYFNTTSAIDAIQFSFSADAIDAGKIKLFGIKDS